MSACFSGGFAEMAFAGGRADKGPAPQDRCGLFATTWDLEATGCDPDPDRRNHEGYAVHFLQALRGRDGAGKPIAVDLDRDDRVSLLEAHTHARVSSRGLDVPTTTAERWLRHTAPAAGAGEDARLVEEDAVISRLTAELKLEGDAAAVEAAAKKRFDELDGAREALASDEMKANTEVERLRRALKAQLLARWPAIDDPWHPAFPKTLEGERDAIDRFLDASDAYAQYLRAREKAAAVEDDALDIALERAPLERLLRAFETRRLAGRLKKRGGRDWQTYQRLLTCERSSLR
jgi:hypothetical protein